MRKCIILLLITGMVLAQTDLDKLVLKDGRIFLGEYSKSDNKTVYFKLNDALKVQLFPENLIQTLKLKDGKVLFDYGQPNLFPLFLDNTIFKKFPKKKQLSLLEYEKLTSEQKTVYDTKKKVKSWFFYSSLIVGLGTLIFFYTFSLNDDFYFGP